MNPRELSHALRNDRSPEMRKRRAIVGLSLAAAGTIGFLAAYQFGIVRRLPDFKSKYFDAERVDSSEEAYSLMWTGDAFLGLTSYAATAALAAMGEPDRARTRPWLVLLMTGKVILDSIVAAMLTWVQWSKHRAFCWYCLVTSALTFAMLPLTWGEVRRALRNIRRSRGVGASPTPRVRRRGAVAAQAITAFRP